MQSRRFLLNVEAEAPTTLNYDFIISQMRLVNSLTT